MFSLAQNKEGVADHFDALIREGGWDPKLRWNLNDWEIDEFLGFMDQVKDFCP